MKKRSLSICFGFLAVLSLGFIKPVFGDPETIYVLSKIVGKVKKEILITGVEHTKSNDEFFKKIDAVIQGQDQNSWEESINFFIEAPAYKGRNKKAKTVNIELAKKYLDNKDNKKEVKPFRFLQADCRTEKVLNFVDVLEFLNRNNYFIGLESSMFAVKKLKAYNQNCGTVEFYKKLVEGVENSIEKELGNFKNFDKTENTEIKKAIQGVLYLSNLIRIFGSKYLNDDIKKFVEDTDDLFEINRFDSLKNSKLPKNSKFVYKNFRVNLFQHVPNVHFLSETLKSQRSVNKTVMFCGALHADFLKDALIELGYKLDYEHRYEHRYDYEKEKKDEKKQKPEVSPTELSSIFSGFIECCNNCYKKTKDCCASCKKVCYCSRQCQVKDWKKGGHNKTCKVIKKFSCKK